MAHYTVNVHNDRIDDPGDFRMVEKTQDIHKAINVMDAVSFPHSTVIVQGEQQVTVASWDLGIRRIPVWARY